VQSQSPSPAPDAAMERLYLDHNATTPLRAEALDAMREVLGSGATNPSSVHASGREARARIDGARERVAAALGVAEDAVVFTSGGTEANNLALFGALEARPSAHLLTSPLEHAAVLEPAQRLEAAGRSVAWVGGDAEGRLDLVALSDATRAARQFAAPPVASFMGANNEIGTLHDLPAIRGAVGDDALLHCDAVQVLGKAPIAPIVEACDLVSLSAHKVGGPIGVGILLRRPGGHLVARTLGGQQEAGLRPGTENVAAIVAGAVAIELAVREADAVAARMRDVLATFCAELLRAVPGAVLNGPAPDDAGRLPNTANVSFPSHGDARMLVTRFDLAGVEVSSGSACASGSLEPSHVLSALGLDDAERVRSAVRFSFGRTSTRSDATLAVERLRTTLGRAS